MVRLQDEYGMKLHLWIGKVIDERRISGQEVNDCLYPELMYGYRRLIRFYKLNKLSLSIKTMYKFPDSLVGQTQEVLPITPRMLLLVCESH